MKLETTNVIVKHENDYFIFSIVENKKILKELTIPKDDFFFSPESSAKRIHNFFTDHKFTLKNK